MTAPLDLGLDFFRQVLALRGYRQEILSADIANASTPGFKAVDLDFAEALRTAGGSAPTWRVDDARHLSPSGNAAGATPAAAASVKYKAGGAVTLDGNSVDLNREKLSAAENAVDYEAAVTFTSLHLKMLLTAINGSSGQQSSGG